MIVGVGVLSRWLHVAVESDVVSMHTALDSADVVAPLHLQGIPRVVHTGLLFTSNSNGF